MPGTVQIRDEAQVRQVLEAKQGAPESLTMWFRTTVCPHRVDGSWLITHEHSSTPFSIDGSFKAAVDLQP